MAFEITIVEQVVGPLRSMKPSGLPVLPHDLVRAGPYLSIFDHCSL